MEKTRARLRIAGVAAFVILAFFSWLIGYNQEAEWVRRVFAPDYKPTLAIIEDMLSTDGSIDSSDPNFESLLAIFQDSNLRMLNFQGMLTFKPIFENSDQFLPEIQYYVGSGPITEIRIEESGSFRIVDGKLEPTYRASYYSDGEAAGVGASMRIAEIWEDLHIVLLDEPLVRSRFTLVSIGIVLSFVLFYYSWILPGESATKEVGIDFVLYWIFATIAGYFIGIAVSLFAAEYIHRLLIQLYFILPQWLIIRTQISRAGNWISASILGFFVGNAIVEYAGQYLFDNLLSSMAFMGIFPLFTIAMRTLVIALIAISQWIVLKRHMNKAGWWILASAISYLIGLAIYFPLFDYFNIELNQLAGLTFPLISWVTMATFTGNALYWLLKKQRRELLAV